jgi:hypothetical protein
VLIEKQRGQAPPHQKGHHHAGPFAAVLLQQRSDRVKNTESEQPQRTRASHIHRWTPPLSCARALPHPPPSSLNRPRFQNCRRDSNQSCSTPKELNQTTKPSPRFDFLSSPPLARSHHFETSSTRKSSALASAVVPHREGSTTLIQPAVSRCKPSHPRLSMPQAPFANVVPHSTDDCVATPAVMARRKQSKGNQTTTPEHQQESGCPDVR